MTTSPLFRSAMTSTSQHIGLLSTYPPKICGLATFAAALERELVDAGHRVDVVRVDDGDDNYADNYSGNNAVVATLVNGVPSSIISAAAVLSQCDVALIQHEYGIFGGADGEEIIDLLQALEVPAIVVFHTVPLDPTPHQKSLLVDIANLAARVVVMTQAARDRLTHSYPIDRAKVVTISHGALSPTREQRREIDRIDRARPQLLTWGLIGPGKGIEHVIDALALLGDVRPLLRYTVAGVTHPKVLARSGDKYRQSLIQRAADAGVGDLVTFDGAYRDVAQLTRFVASASAVVLPYDSRDQVTSGVLVDAIAAGKPVIATAFPHALELLKSGAGIVVPHANPAALAAAIRTMFSDKYVLASMAFEARRLAPSLSWSAVAAKYARLSGELIQSANQIAI
jgi:glycosyltransferase involved in cell wall biosynthesis